jgi:hypothetical protein
METNKSLNKGMDSSRFLKVGKKWKFIRKILKIIMTMNN